MALQDYEIDISKIKPKNIKKSDKYSKAIYKYLKNNPHRRRVWFDEIKFDGESEKFIKVDFDVNNMNLKNMYFGMPDSENSKCISGKCIYSLIQDVRGSQESYSYIGYKQSHYIEVTQEFYEKYIEIGRCIYGHNAFLMDDDNRYTYIDDTHRICNWCGKEQHEEVVTHTYESKVWRDD